MVDERGRTEKNVSALDASGVHYLNELVTRDIAEAFIRPGDAVLDLGANHGFHTRHFSDCLRGKGMVHAFEPNPELWADLLKIENVRLWPVAVGDRTSVENFYLPLEHDQVGSLVDARDFMGDVKVKVLTVPQVRIDDLKEALSSPISFVKIDVERREFHALRGMLETIKAHRPVIVFENNTDEIQAMLEEAGYCVSQMLAQALPEFQLPNVMAYPNEKAHLARRAMPSVHFIEAFLKKADVRLAS